MAANAEDATVTEPGSTAACSNVDRLRIHCVRVENAAIVGGVVIDSSSSEAASNFVGEDLVMVQFVVLVLISGL